MARVKRMFTSADGTPWRVEVQSPGVSNVQVVFVHPDPRLTRHNRYANYVLTGPGTQNVSGRAIPADVLRSLDEATLAKLFRGSMAMSGHPSIDGLRA